jgi:hypothetical protein
VRNPTVQFAAVLLAALGLTGGVFLGLSQIHAQVTTVGPPTVQVQASCGINYAPGIPALSNADPVPLPTDPKILVPRGPYTEQCDRVTSWQPYVSWAITGVGLLGFTVLFFARRQRLADEAGTGSGPPPGSVQSSPLWR